MSQYQRMVSYLYEYKQGVKGVNVGYVRIEQRGTGCRISLQMRSRNLGQLSDVAVFRQRQDGIRYYTIGTLTEKNGDYRCRMETETGNLMGSGIDLLDVDGIIVYQDDAYYIATTWKNQTVHLGENRIWDPAESEDTEESGTVESEPMDAGTEEAVGMSNDDRIDLEQSDMQTGEQKMNQQLSERDDSGSQRQEILGQNGIQQNLDGDGLEDHSQPDLERNESYGRENFDRDDIEQYGGQRHFNEERRFSEEDEEREDIPSSRDYRENRRGSSSSPGQYGYPGMWQLFPRWSGMPLFRRRPVGNGNIPIPQMAEWSNGNRHMAESRAENSVNNLGNERNVMDQERSISGSSCEDKEQMEEQAVCRNCPFKRKGIDYGKRILMTFPVMRPFPGNQQLACVRIEPQDLGCLPMQMWTLANNHFLLQGYYCYRHLIFMEAEKQGYVLGVPGIYDRRTSRQAEQFGFVQFRAICSGKQCEGAFGYWLMPLSC